MPLDKQSAVYQEGKQAFKDGLMLADKPVHFILQEWEAGWHDAHAELTRELAKR